MASVTKDMTIAEVLQLDRETAPVFFKHGMHCLSCPFSTSETLEQAAGVHGVVTDELVNDINAYLASKEA